MPTLISDNHLEPLRSAVAALREKNTADLAAHEQRLIAEIRAGNDRIAASLLAAIREMNAAIREAAAATAGAASKAIA